MDALALKLVATPLLMAAVTLAGRRYGPGVSGWLAGLPLTSGPVSLFLALEQGPAFARDAAPGMLAGFLAFLAFLAGAAWAARRAGWAGTVAAGLVAYAVVEAPLLWLKPTLWPAFAAAVLATAVLVLALRRAPPAVPVPAPRWDVPVRAATATAVVLLVTGLAASLGPRMAGLLSPVPAFAAVLVGFTHHQGGGEAARATVRGIAAGALSFTVFFLVVGLGLPDLGLALTYAAAATGAVLANVGTLRLVRPAAVPARS
ncbi:MAG: hypothetical protein QOD77_1507 [Thermoplasmata archaeon]|nr:hypothetical protein [Thermoplasmata archaeon]